MKKELCLILALAVAGCNSNSALTGAASSVGANVAAANAALAHISNGKLSKACSTISVAQRYFNLVSFLVPTQYVAADRVAISVVNAICQNPPTNVSIALNDLATAWATIQAATTIPR